MSTRLDPITDVITDIREGRMVLIVDDEDRENEADLVIAADAITPDAVNFMIRMGRGLVCAALSADRVAELDLPMMPTRGREKMGTAFTVSVDARDTTTGISAHERAHTLRLLADPAAGPDEFVAPGHVFPLRARPGGVMERPGHTEAAVDLARLAERFPAGAICEILHKSGSMLRPNGAVNFARRHGLKISSVRALQQHRLEREQVVSESAVTEFPSRYGQFKLHSFVDPAASDCHLALVRLPSGPTQTLPLVRLHSECLTGDALGSLRCDCGNQLATALELIERHGHGALLYMRQEGRGIGLTHKIKAYELQDRGLDTVDANLALGHPPDGRDYALAAKILHSLGLTRIELLSNNPAKREGLARYGIAVQRMRPLIGEVNEHNRRYLATKQQRLGHLL